MASADPHLAREQSVSKQSVADQAAAAWESALAGIEANLDATEGWLDGLAGRDGETHDGAAHAGAGVGQVPPGAGRPAAAAPLWTRPEGLPALPEDQADRVRRLLERQREIVRRAADARQAVGGQLEAVRQVLATKAPAPGIYLDTKG